VIELPQETPMDGAEVHPPHAPHTGHRWWDFAIGGTAVLVSLISLYVAVHHGQIMEKLVAANSWPNIEVSFNVRSGASPDNARFEIAVTNNGIGPARIETLELWNGTTPIESIDAIGALIKGKGDAQTVNSVSQSATVIGSVIGARETVIPVAIETTAIKGWEQSVVATAGDLQSRVCFCSVFDECRVADSRETSPKPVVVASCPVPSTSFSDNISSLKSAPTPAPPTP
jgi:hypothetical protein